MQDTKLWSLCRQEYEFCMTWWEVPRVPLDDLSVANQPPILCLPFYACFVLIHPAFSSSSVSGTDYSPTSPALTTVGATFSWDQLKEPLTGTASIAPQWCSSVVDESGRRKRGTRAHQRGRHRAVGRRRQQGPPKLPIGADPAVRLTPLTDFPSLRWPVIDWATDRQNRLWPPCTFADLKSAGWDEMGPEGC